MPRYYFHLFEDQVLRDEEGIELDGGEAVRRAALSEIHQIMCDQVRAGKISLDHHIEVEDEGGENILSMRFGEAVAVEGR